MGCTVFSKVIGKTKRFIVKNGGSICTALGCVGVVATGVLSYMAGAKCDKILSDLNEEMDGDPSFKDKVVALAPSVAPAVIVGGMSIATIIFGRGLDRKQILLLASSNATLSATLFDLKRTVKERLGEEEYYEMLREKADKERSDIKIFDEGADESFWDDELGIVTLDDHGALFNLLDGYDSIWFRQDPAIVYSAGEAINRDLKKDGFVSKEDYFLYLGFDPFDIPEKFTYNGWSAYQINKEIGCEEIEIVPTKKDGYFKFPFMGYATPEGEIKADYTILDIAIPSRALF